MVVAGVVTSIMVLDACMYVGVWNVGVEAYDCVTMTSLGCVEKHVDQIVNIFVLPASSVNIGT